MNLNETAELACDVQNRVRECLILSMNELAGHMTDNEKGMIAWVAMLMLTEAIFSDHLDQFKDDLGAAKSRHAALKRMM